MKFAAIAFVVIAGLIIIRDGLAFGQAGKDVPISSLPSISVSGYAEAQAIPDVSRFTFEIRKEGKTVNESQQGVTAVLNPIIDALEDAGVDEKDIKTVGYNSYPEYDYVQASIGIPGRQVLRAYVTNASVEVTVRDTTKAGDMLTLAGQKGATGLSQLNFVVDNPAKVQAEARKKAIEDARAKAELLADDLGVRLGRIVSYSENGGGMPMPYYATRDSMAGTEAAQAAPNLPVGQNEYQVNVSIQYEIK